jgi:CheY-like chemotaxis protein
MEPTGPELPSPIRVVVVDADDLVRQTVAALLGIGGRIAVVGMAGQTGPALEIVSVTRPDVVVVDPRLPDLDTGLAFVQRLRLANPAARVLIVCSAELLDPLSGADGVDRCVRKTFRPDDLTAAIVATSLGTQA